VGEGRGAAPEGDAIADQISHQVQPDPEKVSRKRGQTDVHRPVERFAGGKKLEIQIVTQDIVPAVPAGGRRKLVGFLSQRIGGGVGKQFQGNPAFGRAGFGKGGGAQSA